MPTWVQDRETGEFILKQHYRRAEPLGPRIQADIDAFISPVDGKPIYSRRQLREHNRRHGVTDMRDYGDTYFERKAGEREAELRGATERARAERIETIQRAIERNGG